MRVIDRQIPVKVGFGSVVLEIALWIFLPIMVFLYVHFFGAMFPEPMLGLIFIFVKVAAKNYFQQLEQRIQAEPLGGIYPGNGTRQHPYEGR